jgi:circadian clock protein KaiB
MITSKTATAIRKKSSQIQKKGDRWILQLYVAGNTPKAATAIKNITRICEKLLKGKYRLEVIDLWKKPDRAHNDQILALPTLVRSSPLPVRNIIGDLSNTERVLASLELLDDNAIQRM